MRTPESRYCSRIAAVAAIAAAAAAAAAVVVVVVVFVVGGKWKTTCSVVVFSSCFPFSISPLCLFS